VSATVSARADGASIKVATITMAIANAITVAMPASFVSIRSSTLSPASHGRHTPGI